MEPRAPLPLSAAAEPAPAAAAASWAADHGVVVALSEDHALLQALTLGVIEQAPVITSPSVDRFIDQLMANRAEVALIDAASAPAPLEQFVSALHQQFPRLLVVLAGSAQLQTSLSAQITDGTIFRFAHKPVSAQRLKLFISAALQSATLRSRRAAAGVAGTTDAAQERGVGGASARSSLAGGSRRWLWPLMLAATAAGALVLGWLASSYAPHRPPLP
jgi:DNA-binding NtrC family response regulator